MGRTAFDAYDPSFAKRRRIVRIGKFLILCIVFLAGILPNAMALFGLDLAAMQQTYTDYVDAIATELDRGMFAAVEQVFITKGGDIPVDQLVNNEIFTNVANALIGLAYLMVMFSAIPATIRDTIHGDAEFGMWMKYCIIITLSVAVLSNWQVIAGWVQAFGDWIIGHVNAVVGTHGEEGVGAWVHNVFDFGSEPFNGKTFKQSLTLWNEDLWKFLFMIVKFVGVSLVLIIMEIPLIQARVTCLAILMEIWLRYAFFPVAIADIAGNGMRSPGIQYMKKFFALYVRAGACLVVAAMCQVMINALASGIGGLTIVQGLFRLFVIYTIFRIGPKMFSSSETIADAVAGV